MSSASNSRIGRRLAAKSAPKVRPYVEGEAPKAIITLTEVPGENGANPGFTIGLGLHGARMQELFPDRAHTVSIVDVIALAVTQIIRSQPQDFKDSVSLVNDTLRNVHQALEGGADVETAMAEADATLDGALSDQDPAANAEQVDEVADAG